MIQRMKTTLLARLFCVDRSGGVSLQTLSHFDSPPLADSNFSMPAATDDDSFDHDCPPTSSRKTRIAKLQTIKNGKPLTGAEKETARKLAEEAAFGRQVFGSGESSTISLTLQKPSSH